MAGGFTRLAVTEGVHTGGLRPDSFDSLLPSRRPTARAANWWWSSGRASFGAAQLVRVIPRLLCLPGAGGRAGRK